MQRDIVLTIYCQVGAHTHSATAIAGEYRDCKAHWYTDLPKAQNQRLSMSFRFSSSTLPIFNQRSGLNFLG